MKRLYICGSFRFSTKMEELERLIVAEGFDVLVSKNSDARGISGCLEKIDRADAAYVVNPGGYVGKSVSVDLGYAFARNKPIHEE